MAISTVSAAKKPRVSKAPPSPIVERFFDPIELMDEDIKEAVKTLKRNEIRYLVDAYYLIQKDRIRTENQVNALAEAGEPYTIVGWLANTFQRLENNIKIALKIYSNEHRLGRWADSIIGIDGILAAGLLAHIDITKAPTAGSIWRYAGLDPSIEWLGREKARKVVEEYIGDISDYEISQVDTEALMQVLHRKLESLKISFKDETGAIVSLPLIENLLTTENLAKALAKRPWNGGLKTICWKVGESFVKQQNHENDIYGKYYVLRRREEDERNSSGQYTALATDILGKKAYKKDTVAYQYYSQGMLPPDHIYSRAKRWAVKLFLSHFHYVAYVCHYKIPPAMPYVINVLGHKDYIAPPNWPIE